MQQHARNQQTRDKKLTPRQILKISELAVRRVVENMSKEESDREKAKLVKTLKLKVTPQTVDAHLAQIKVSATRCLNELDLKRIVDPAFLVVAAFRIEQAKNSRKKLDATSLIKEMSASASLHPKYTSRLLHALKDYLPYYQRLTTKRN